MIIVDNLTKRYGDTIGVKGVSFSVAKGEIVGFLGPNGAGKTTTMRCITGYHPPSQGSIQVADFDVVDEPLDARRQIGYLPEIPPVYPEMTVREYLSFVADLKDVPRRDRKDQIEQIVSRLSLQDVFGRLIGHLSKGFRQRVGLAQALVGNPPILILDEPTAGLDPKQIIEVRELIRGLGAEHTIILSSHILPEVSAVCERVLIINKGQLVASDTPDGLARALEHSHRFTAVIEGRPDDVSAKLASLDGVLAAELVEDAKRVGDDAAPIHTYQIDLEPSADVRRSLFFALAEINCPIFELTPLRLSLEDAFLQLTTEEPAHAPEATDDKEGDKSA